MSTTTLPKRVTMKRNITAESMPSTTSNSISGSPNTSPAASASSTSLSSMASIDDHVVGNKMIDTYGNEFKLPDFTMKQVRDAIPKHCFERSAVKSLGFLARDIVYLGTTFYLFNRFCTPGYVPSFALRTLLWAGYTFMQGLFATGVWVLSHECGHQAFSSSKTLNDTVGWIFHSALLVPYFSWKISHGKHHKATGNMERDMVHVPRTREQQAARHGFSVEDMHELLEETPIATLIHLVVQQLGGWPAYILLNVTGHNNHHKQVEGKGIGRKNGDGSVNHFLPSSPLYERKDEYLILLSDLGILLAFAGLFYIGHNFGWTNLLVWYFIPYLWVNHWLVAITYLQHTDPSLPHYTSETWNFARGATATIDREFGFIGRHFLHGIIETHVLHHLISTIPFYNADEASEAIKPVLGKHYRSDTRGGSIGFIKAMYNSARWCQWVEPSEGTEGENANVLFYRNRNGLGTAPAKIVVAA